jgi:ribonuclease BN (tRNA processing enzyme)
MQLSILGCYGPYPPAGGACSGYLLQEKGCSILLDCGNGVLSRLQNYLALWQLDAVLLSHLHADHFSDIMIMRYGLEMAYKRGLRSEPLPLYAPADPVSEFERLPYKNAYNVMSIADSLELMIGPFRISFRAGIHAVPALSMRIESPSATLVYSGDTEYYLGLEDLAAGADLFLCEANYSEADLDAGLPNHLSATQAAQIAAAAKVKRLMLTHHYPERNPELSLSAAAKYYPDVELAAEQSVVDV